jgi:hypothetical protein
MNPSCELFVYRGRESGVFEIEASPVNWPAVDYHLWQLLAACKEMGCKHVRRGKPDQDLALPIWVSKKWKELHWWQRFRG